MIYVLFLENSNESNFGESEEEEEEINDIFSQHSVNESDQSVF